VSVCGNCGEVTTGRIMRHQCPAPEAAPSPSPPERAERRVLARGWTIVNAAGELCLGCYCATAENAWNVWRGSWDPRPTQIEAEANGFRAIYVKTVEVESPPPEGGKEESRG
jgi:hypothetical protein